MTGGWFTRLGARFGAWLRSSPGCMLWFVLFRVVLSLRLLFSATNRLFVNRIHSIMDTPSTSAQPPEDTPPPAPFTPEQLQWIDRLIANRHAQSTGTEASGFPQPPPASSAILSTPASQPGESSLSAIFY